MYIFGQCCLVIKHDILAFIVTVLQKKEKKKEMQWSGYEKSVNALYSMIAEKVSIKQHKVTCFESRR
jgi:hypothetical protein